MFRHFAMHFEDGGYRPHQGGRCGRDAHFGGHRDRHEWGHGFGPRGGFGSGRERMFDGGEIRLVILQHSQSSLATAIN